MDHSTIIKAIQRTEPIIVASTKPKLPEYLQDSPLLNHHRKIQQINDNQSNTDRKPLFESLHWTGQTMEVVGSSETSRKDKLTEALSGKKATFTQQGTYVLPSYWNPEDKCKLLEVSNGNLRVSYQGSGKTDADAASIRADVWIPPQTGIYYYEVTIVSKGRDGYIGVGFGALNVSLGRLPGWDDLSWGYHGDDGNFFGCSGVGKTYGPSFTTGDVVGCLLNFMTMSISFTKNGILLG